MHTYFHRVVHVMDSHTMTQDVDVSILNTTCNYSHHWIDTHTSMHCVGIYDIKLWKLLIKLPR
jgi:hypothetical protein